MKLVIGTIYTFEDGSTATWAEFQTFRMRTEGEDMAGANTMAEDAASGQFPDRAEDF